MDFINNSNHFDQHFLIDDNIIYSFIDVSKFNSSDIVVEVGPGKGTLTSLIAKKVKKLYCIEVDLRLKPYLDEICRKNNNVEIIYSSVLNVDIPICNKIITSLPYSIIEPFMNKMIKTNFDELIMITGNKFASSVENNEISYLSLLTNCFFDFEKIMEINPVSFNPQPRTMSAMIKLKHKDNDDNIINSFFKNMYLLNHKKAKNGIIESFIATGYCSTQREARELIKIMNISNDLLETKFEIYSNDQLLNLYESVKKLFDGKNRYRISK